MDTTIENYKPPWSQVRGRTEAGPRHCHRRQPNVPQQQRTLADPVENDAAAPTEHLLLDTEYAHAAYCAGPQREDISTALILLALSRACLCLYEYVQITEYSPNLDIFIVAIGIKAACILTLALSLGFCLRLLYVRPSTASVISILSCDNNNM